MKNYMNISQLILAICLITTVSCGVWYEVEKSFFHPFSHSDTLSWISIPLHPNLVTICDGKSVLGGYGLFSKGQILQKKFTGLPYFEKIKIKLTLYQIDSWDLSTLDEFQIKINGVLVQSELKSSGHDGGVQKCGGNWGDEIVDVLYQGDHTGTEFLLTFTDTLNQDPFDESWGISNLEIQIYLPCEPPLIKFGNLCLSVDHLNHCHRLLGLLDSSEIKNSTISNHCEPEVIDDEQVYHIFFQYNKPFFLDPQCLTQEVYIEDVLIPEGKSPFNEWQFDPSTQTTKFTIKHKDLIPKFKCQLIETLTEYIWVCDVHIKIYLGGVLQFHFKCQIKIILSRVYKNKLVVNVSANIVVGECCENQLKIKTELRFCTDFTCVTYLPSPLTIKRKQSFFVVHLIITPEFQFYYLHGISVTLGSFLPVIVKFNGSIQGKLIYELQSYIAFDGLILTVISRLSTVPSRLLRVLSKEESKIDPKIGDNYKIKTDYQLSIQNEDKDKDNTKQNQEGINTVLVATVGVVGGIALFSIAGTTFYCLKMKKKQKLNKYKDQVEKNQTYEEQEMVSQP